MKSMVAVVFLGLVCLLGITEGKLDVKVNFSREKSGKTENPLSCDFGVWDTNKDGSVDIKEFTHQMSTVAGRTDSKEIFEIADTDNDQLMSEEELKASSIISC